MSDELQQAIDFLRSERERETEVYVVHLSTGYGIEHVWTLLDRIATLEAVAAAANRFVNNRNSSMQRVEYELLKDALAAAGQGENDETPADT